MNKNYDLPDNFNIFDKKCIIRFYSSKFWLLKNVSIHLYLATVQVQLWIGNLVQSIAVFNVNIHKVSFFLNLDEKWYLQHFYSTVENQK